MDDTTSVVRRRLGTRTLAACLAVVALGASACGSDSDGESASGEASGEKPAGFVGAKPEPGTDIPKADVKFGMRPYADNAFYYLGIKKGFYTDNGITVGPGEFGITNNENAISQMLNDTVQMQAMYAPSLVPTYKTDDSLKQVMFTDYFDGWALLASPKLKAKTVKQFLEEGMDFEAAMKATLEQVKGKELVVAPLLDARGFVKQSFEIAGLPQPKLKVLDDPKSLIAARAGRSEFAVPTGAPTTLQFENEGWTPLVRPSDIIDNSEGGADSPATALAGTVGLASNEEWINENPNTVLRFVSATYRLIDEIKKDPSILDEYAPFLNSKTGLSLKGEEIAKIFETYDPLTDFEFGETYCRDESKILHYKNAYGGIIQSYVEQGAVPKGKATPEDLIWTCAVWEELMKYKEQTDAALEKAGDGGDAELIAKAKELYEQRNYLDAYRLATAAAS
jgi:ABC-type nitrate/sulfonate/bicarbonate transport system substrate-binding protein